MLGLNFKKSVKDKPWLELLLIKVVHEPKWLKTSFLISLKVLEDINLTDC